MRFSDELNLSIRCQAMMKLDKGKTNITLTGPRGLLVTKTAEQWNQIINNHTFQEVLNANTQSPGPVRIVKPGRLLLDSRGHPIPRGH